MKLELELVWQIGAVLSCMPELSYPWIRHLTLTLSSRNCLIGARVMRPSIKDVRTEGQPKWVSCGRGGWGSEVMRTFATWPKTGKRGLQTSANCPRNGQKRA